MSFEDDLRSALQRESPPAGFAGRVLARINAGESAYPQESRGTRGTEVRPRNTAFARAAAASLTLAMLLGGYGTHRVIEQRRGERARDQVLEAMRIAGEKVRFAREEVRAVGSHD